MRDHADAHLTLASLSIQGFRNLADARFEPAPGSTLLLGRNGSGKTSVLEAGYLAATTKSFRTRDLAACVRHGASGAALRGEFTGPGGERATLFVAIGVEGARRARNDKPSSLSEHLAVQPVLAWTSGERELLSGPPAGRRRFLDRGLVSERPAMLGELAAYRRALEQKRALLAGRPAAGAVAAWNDVLAPAAARLVRQRADYVEGLRAELQAVLEEAGLGLPPVDMTYAPSPAAARQGEEAIAAAFDQSRDEELRRHRPLVGPHRDDVVIAWGGARLRDVASAGERKALGLLLLLAQARRLETVGAAPLVLLDDADTELDERALGRLWALFAGRQTIASSNRPRAWEGLAVERRMTLEHGEIKRLDSNS